MKRIDLTDFNIPDLYVKMEKNKKKFNKGLQTEMVDFNKKKFICPISFESFENKLQHKLKCRYKYCKSGWVFREVVK